MIIDIHTHTFPDALAPIAVKKLLQCGQMSVHTDATKSGLISSAKQCGIDLCILQPIASKASQTETINAEAILVNQTTETTGLMSFGTIHPDNENYTEILDHLKLSGVIGIKLHSFYHKLPIDHPKILRIIDYASSLGLAILIHCGKDPSFPNEAPVTPKLISSMFEKTHPTKLILAHMGGLGEWNEVEKFLYNKDIYFDCSTCLAPVHLMPKHYRYYLEDSRFVSMVRHIGADRIFFGTDSPWASQCDYIDAVNRTSLSQTEKNMIFYQNAMRVLGIHI